ncbi:AAA family ATPase [Reichenbachiella versicolor]|uniref:AAA family ATPase n=1 Tax=Reichenbachiella versicolor TaxID=1821036 RepID=UPI000D6E2009|nr:AAA family ATPase [Reichenbachiella versicolor]
MWNKYKLAPISSFNMIQDNMHEAHEKKQLMVIIGATGFGKTVGFHHYMNYTNYKCYYTQIKPAEAAKPFFYRLNDLINERDIGMDNYRSSSSLNWLIEKSSYDFLNKKDNPMLIIDEAGNFKKNSQSYLRQVWDNIKGNSAMIISGPDRYDKNLKTWNRDLSTGIPELVSRINNWKYVPAPTYEDIKLICLENEIDDKRIIKFIYENSHNLRNVKDYVLAYHNGELPYDS